MTAPKKSGDASAEKYEMTVDLSVLESLGINLYSNAAAVLTELVANAYDADATLVSISWTEDGTQVVVADDGSGMNVEELNSRFLTVGYKKRENEGKISPRWKRPFMGRKGIGKLSVFSLANTVSVYSTVENGPSNGLRIVVGDLEKKIKAQQPYHPKEVSVPSKFARKGTVLVLDDLKKKRASLTAKALRRRLARRFDVIDETAREKGGFKLEVNGSPITWKDRQELKKLEFIWEFGGESLPDDKLPKEIKRFEIKKDSIPGHPAWKVKGWIGTARKPSELAGTDEDESLKNVIVLARKRPIQEGIVDKLDFNKIFANYVTGQIEADFLDLDDSKYDDIATSDRQRLIEDDERVVGLRTYLRDVFGKCAEEWSEHRPKKATKDTLERFPKLREWVDSREPWQQKPAEKMIGTIASLELDDEAEQSRSDLLRAGVLAFERVGLRKVVEDLDALSEVTADDLLPLLGRQDIYESGLWADILRSRVEAISNFENLTSANQREKVLQEHLFSHLWLLDPGWERATSDPKMEEDIRAIEPSFVPRDSQGKQISGRMDIRYAKTNGEHVIVELKRYGRKTDVDDLYDQGLKYYTALRKVLDKQQKNHEPIQVAFVLGSPPTTKKQGSKTEDEYRRERLEPIHGRYVLYDALIAGARAQYSDYLDATTKVAELTSLLDELGD